MRDLFVARNVAGETHCVLENGVVVADCDDLSLLEHQYGLTVKSSDKKFIHAVGHWLDTAKTREVEDLVTRSLERHIANPVLGRCAKRAPLGALFVPFGFSPPLHSQ